MAGSSAVTAAQSDGPARPDTFRVVAIVAAYNEADIIGDVVADLIHHGVEVYLLDHWSTDATVAIVERHLGKGVIGIEKFPSGGDAVELRQQYAWERILKRKEALARELDAQWLIHHDADEFRESPWADRTLVEGIRLVDQFGYNAIDFEVFNFRPTHDRFQAGDDVRAAFPYYEPAEAFNKIQVRCWKKAATQVDLTSTGGHEAIFPGRNVFPVRFILRHYPIRSQSHGQRKIFTERRPRFVAEERARGWHIQYEAFTESDTFVRDPAALTRYDADAVRLHLFLRHRDYEDLNSQTQEAKRIAADLTTRQARGNQRSEVSQPVGERLNAPEVSPSRAVETLAESFVRCNAQLFQLTEDLADTRTRTQALSEQLEQSDLNLRQARGELLQRADEVVRLEHELAAAARRIEELTGFLLAAHSAEDALRGDLDALRAQLTTLRHELASANAELVAVFGSASWRWTAPARFVKRIIGR
jgi:glycosyltransferase involved in cell wall biosynthesis